MPRHGRRCDIGCRTQCAACMLACCASLLWTQSCQQTGACHSQPGCLSRFRCAYLWHGMLGSAADSGVKDSELAFIYALAQALFNPSRAQSEGYHALYPCACALLLICHVECKSSHAPLLLKAQTFNSSTHVPQVASTVSLLCRCRMPARAWQDLRVTQQAFCVY